MSKFIELTKVDLDGKPTTHIFINVDQIIAIYPAKSNLGKDITLIMVGDGQNAIGVENSVKYVINEIYGLAQDEYGSTYRTSQMELSPHTGD